MESTQTLPVIAEFIMFTERQSQRAVLAFILAVLLAVTSSAVCVAFGADPFPWATSHALMVGQQGVPNLPPLAERCAPPNFTAEAMPTASSALRAPIGS
jgi:hypothetical protein